MVRINFISPKLLSDQHLIAEYNEILMLLGYIKKYPSLENIPKEYCLGKGHIRFFKNKLCYLKSRHESIKAEMRSRGFSPKKSLTISAFGKLYLNDWKPRKKDIMIIKNRLASKIKPDFRYYSERKPKNFFIALIRKGKL
jgi:deoxyribonuclease (pyrimidine dimer)